MENQKIPNMCRLCLTTKRVFLKFIDSKTDWAVLLKQLTGIDPFEDTRYPQKLCLPCRNKLDLYSKFRKKCLESQTKFSKQFLDNQPSLDMTVEMEVGLTQSPVAATSYKPDKYLDWSDDEFFAPEKNKIKDESENFFELVAIVHEEVRDDKNSIKFEEVVIKSEDVEIEEEVLDVKTEEKNDNISSTDSESDSDFDFEPAPKKRRPKGPAPKVPPGICHICGMTISRKTMNFHLNWHDDLRPFVCKFEGCTESFNSPAREKKHRNRHYEPKAVCTICDMKFFDNSYLKRHMLRHSKKWENVCPHCSKKCATRYNLKVHMRVHTGDRPFACNNCTAAFAYNSLLKSHNEKCVGERSREDKRNENVEQ